MAGFDKLHREAVGGGVLPKKVKELIALAVAICVHCDGCITCHVRDVLSSGASQEEIVEAIGVAILMGGAPAVVYGAQALRVVEQFQELAAEAS